MYLKFYNFKHKPFQINTDPRFLWMGPKHKEAFAVLRYGLHDNIGFLLLTGDVGTGKTTLINGLLGTLNSDSTHISFIRDPGFTQLEFFQYTAHSFGLDASIINNKTQFLIHFEKFLFQAYEEQRRVLLIIDEAQRISQELLEEVRLLSNLEREDTKLLNIFFVGQTEFNDMLVRTENNAIRQRISVHYNLEVLDQEETIKYIQHRLRVSSSEENFGFFSPLGKSSKGAHGLTVRGLKLPELREEIFTMDAIRAVYTFSKGYPRVINTLCDRALLTGFVEVTKPITRAHVEECAKELEIPGDQNSRSSDNRKKLSTGHRLSGANPHNEGSHLQHNGAEAAASPKFPRNSTKDDNAAATDTTYQQTFAGPAEPVVSKEPLTVKRSSAEIGRSKVVHDIEMQELLHKVEELEQIARKWEENKTATNDPGMVVESPETDSRGLLSIKKMVSPVVVLALMVLIIYGIKADEPFAFLQKYQISGYQTVASESPLPSAQRKDAPNEKEYGADTLAPGLHSIGDQSADKFEKTIRFPDNAIFPSDDELAILKELHKHAAGYPDLQVLIIYPVNRDLRSSRNTTLAISRANTVKSYLMGRGLEPSRIIVTGESDPSLSGVPGSNRQRSYLQADHIKIFLSE